MRFQYVVVFPAIASFVAALAIPGNLHNLQQKDVLQWLILS